MKSGRRRLGWTAEGTRKVRLAVEKMKKNNGHGSSGGGFFLSMAVILVAYFFIRIWWAIKSGPS